MGRPQILRLSILHFLLTMMVLAAWGPTAHAQETAVPVSLGFTVYEDGVVRVEYALSVDVTRPRVVVNAFGGTFSDLIVTDGEGNPLDFSVDRGALTVDTLGADFVQIDYITRELTNKTGLVWTFAVDAPVNSSILLPQATTILSLNTVPASIQSIDGQSKLTMPPGPVQVAYMLPLPARTTPPPPGVTPTPPAEPQPPTIVESNSRVLIAAFGAVIAAAVALGVFGLSRRRGPSPQPIMRERHEVDIERLDKDNPTLREEDREVLHFIAESGGEATESEIRERFKLPKTTVWRMSKRLRKEGIVDLHKLGGANVVRIRKKYRKSMGETE